MSLDQTPAARRRWFRFTIRRTMIALPFIAVAIVLAAGIDPFRRDPMQQALDQATRWCAIPTDQFKDYTNQHQLIPAQKPINHKSGLLEKPCILKFDNMETVSGNSDKIRDSLGKRVALAEDGQCHGSFNYGMSAGNGWSTQTADEMAMIKRLLPTLPPSHTEIPAGKIEVGMGQIGSMQKGHWVIESRVFVIGFQHQGVWITRTYDKKRLPPELVEMLNGGGLGYYIPGQGDEPPE